MANFPLNHYLPIEIRSVFPFKNATFNAVPQVSSHVAAVVRAFASFLAVLKPMEVWSILKDILRI